MSFSGSQLPRSVRPEKPCYLPRRHIELRSSTATTGPKRWSVPGLRMWVGLDVGKGEHFAGVLDDDGERLFARPADLYPGEAKTDRRDAYVMADTGRTRRKQVHWLDAGSDELLGALRVLNGYDIDLAADAARLASRLRDALTSIAPALERAVGDRLHQAGVRDLLAAYPTLTALIVSIGGMAVGSTGGMASGPAAAGWPSMAASAAATSASPKSASDAEGPASDPAGVIFSKNRSSSTGTGMTSVLFFSPATSTTVCSSRSCSAAGSRAITLAAAASRLDAWYSPSAVMILARRSRSASACRDMDRFMPSGSDTSLISTLSTFTPHGPSVPSSMIADSLRFTMSRSASSSSISDWPIIERSEVWARWEIAFW